MLFSGSLRMNLDPFDAHTDHEIWSVLESAHFNNFVTGMKEGLHYDVTEGGDNLRYESLHAHYIRHGIT